MGLRPRPAAVVQRQGRNIIGCVNLASRLAPTASQLYGSNLAPLLAEMGGAKSFHIDLDDEVVRGALVLRDGELLWPPPRKEPPPAPPRPEPKLPVAHAAPNAPPRRSPAGPVAVAPAAAAQAALGQVS